MAGGGSDLSAAETVVTPRHKSVVEPAYLSLCIIAKNGDRTLAPLFDSIAGIFDEVIFVDTGSLDDTRNLAQQRLIPPGEGRTLGKENLWQAPWPADGADVLPGAGEIQHIGSYRSYPNGKEVPDGKRYRVTLARFQWCYDFAAARQYAFGLATGKWRMYLDCDDRLEYRGEQTVTEKRADGSTYTRKGRPNLRMTIAEIERRDPSVNTISFPYFYAEGDTHQDAIRCVRWSDGWQWEDEVHEFLEPKVGRVVAMVPDTGVLHDKTHEEDMLAVIRNGEIIDRVLAKASELKPEKLARMRYHDAIYHRRLAGGAPTEETRLAHIERAIDGLDYVEKNLPIHTSFPLYAMRDRVQLLVLDKGDHNAAIDVAARMIARYPELKDGYEHMGYIFAKKGEFQRAAIFFDQALARTRPVWSSVQDIWWNEGVVPTTAAIAYARVGRVEDAQRSLYDAHKCRRHPAVLPPYADALRYIARADGLRRLMDLVDYYLWDTQAPKALELLENAPAAVAELPEVKAKIREILARLPHLKSWDDYKAAYASIPDEVYHTSKHDQRAVLFQSRARKLIAHVTALPKEGEPIRVLAVGAQDGIIEREILALNPRIHVTFVDAAPQASRGFEELVQQYGPRVKRHEMQTHYDWVPQGQWNTFDLAILFEVIEHVPQPHRALQTLSSALDNDGKLFLSCPVADRWVEPYLTGPAGPPFFGHLHAWSPRAIHKLLSQYFIGDLDEGFDGTYVYVGRPRGALAIGSSIGIFATGVPPFDAVAGERGHLGGSEEAIIHLSRELVALGHTVVVYAPLFADHEGGRVLGRDGVLWRDVSEFDVGGDEHQAVLFWRCPGVMQDARAMGPYRKALWLHDADYGNIPADCYAKADDVIVLSRFHSSCLEKWCGYPQKDNVRVLGNGIDPREFPERDVYERDLFKAVYCSSPDRGLSILLDIWPEVKGAVPEATLDIYYDWAGARWLKPELVTKLHAQIEELKDQGVVRVGGVPHEVLNDRLRHASILAYPAIGDAETFCITIARAQAAGCFPVVFGAGAIPETIVGGGSAVVSVKDNTPTEKDIELYRETLIAALRSAGTFARRKMRTAALERHDWRAVAKRFADVLDVIDPGGLDVVVRGPPIVHFNPDLIE